MKPLLAVSLGDPAGIGPEIVVRAALDSRVRRACRLRIFGDAGVLQVAGKEGKRALEGGTRRSALEALVPITKLRLAGALPRPSRRAGEAAFRYLEAATAEVLAGTCDALVTAPLNKLWLNRAGHRYDGHTGYLSEATGQPATMMLAGERLRVVLATTHIALGDVPKQLNTDAIVRAGKTTSRHLRDYHGVAKPRLAVAALNPHAGESGLFGDEEARIIAPAVRRLRRGKVDASGPFPADTLFAAAASGHYDAVVCMYHDQALIPLKLLEFGRSINVSMGLPLLRTSPDHGTAYDLAGTGKASAESMIAAILSAARMVVGKRAASRSVRSV